MKYKKIIGWIQIVFATILGFLSYFKLDVTIERFNGILGDSYGYILPIISELGWIKTVILTICILIILQGVVNVKSKD